MSTLASLSQGMFADNVCYAELELNQVAFPFTGRIEARMPLKSDTLANDGFSLADPAQVGMILKVDKQANEICRPGTTDENAPGTLYALNYSTEVNYDERTPGLRYFKQAPATPVPGVYDWRSSLYDDFYPRLGYLELGDRFTTSAVTAAAAPTLGKPATETYVYVGDDGFWTTTSRDDGPACIVEEYCTMADGSYAAKLVVVRV